MCLDMAWVREGKASNAETAQCICCFLETERPTSARHVHQHPLIVYLWKVVDDFVKFCSSVQLLALQYHCSELVRWEHRICWRLHQGLNFRRHEYFLVDIVKPGHGVLGFRHLVFQGLLEFLNDRLFDFDEKGELVNIEAQSLCRAALASHLVGKILQD